MRYRSRGRRGRTSFRGRSRGRSRGRRGRKRVNTYLVPRGGVRL